jgi:hypothetical protein
MTPRELPRHAPRYSVIIIPCVWVVMCLSRLCGTMDGVCVMLRSSLTLSLDRAMKDIDVSSTVEAYGRGELTREEAAENIMSTCRSTLRMACKPSLISLLGMILPYCKDIQASQLSPLLADVRDLAFLRNPSVDTLALMRSIDEHTAVQVLRELWTPMTAGYPIEIRKPLFAMVVWALWDKPHLTSQLRDNIDDKAPEASLFILQDQYYAKAINWRLYLEWMDYLPMLSFWKAVDMMRDVGGVIDHAKRSQLMKTIDHINKATLSTGQWDKVIEILCDGTVYSTTGGVALVKTLASKDSRAWLMAYAVSIRYVHVLSKMKTTLSKQLEKSAPSPTRKWIEMWSDLHDIAVNTAAVISRLEQLNTNPDRLATISDKLSLLLKNIQDHLPIVYEDKRIVTRYDEALKSLSPSEEEPESTPPSSWEAYVALEMPGRAMSTLATVMTLLPDCAVAIQRASLVRKRARESDDESSLVKE